MELAFWNSIEESTSPLMFEEYLVRYPEGLFSGLAKIKIEERQELGDPMVKALDGSAYLDGGISKVGVILLHAMGKHSRWKVVDPLRKSIHDQLGFHTLSLQLPNERKSWEKYAEDFPEVYKRIAAGIAFLREQKEVSRIYLMGHSMGSRMATAFLAMHPYADTAGFIGVGMRNSTNGILNSARNLRQVGLPVIDVWGTGGDGKDVAHAQRRSDLFSRANYRPVVIAGANHSFDGYESKMTEAIVEWLRAMP